MADPANEALNLERGLTVVDTEPEAVEQGRSLVVVIGIDVYDYWQPLNNAVKDATGLQQTLIDKFGFSPLFPPLLDKAATKIAITSLVEDQLREKLKEDDSLILFFAGHGHTRVDKVGGRVVGETGFIIPVEGRGPREVWGDYIQIDPLLQSISRLPARHILVILDSCHSGFALGEAMRSFRSAGRYERDLSSRISRKVITSARREQLALDTGPIPGHSLFTGILVDGFNWGKADLDGDGLITSSELGLFLQQQVGQASESQQTPDFGSFDLDDRGELVISIRNQSFDALKARAFSALQKGELVNFKELVTQITSLEPSRPESLYLQYRLMLFQQEFRKAFDSLEKLASLNLEEGRIPLSNHDLQESKLQLTLNIKRFEVPESDSPLEIKFVVGEHRNTFAEAKDEQSSEGVKFFVVKQNSLGQLNIKNFATHTVNVEMIKIDSRGRILSGAFWQNQDVSFEGLPPQESQPSYIFTINDDIGICERYLFSSKSKVQKSPSYFGNLSISDMEESIFFSELDIRFTRKQVLRYRITNSLSI